MPRQHNDQVGINIIVVNIFNIAISPDVIFYLQEAFNGVIHLYNVQTVNWLLKRIILRLAVVMGHHRIKI